MLVAALPTQGPSEMYSRQTGEGAPFRANTVEKDECKSWSRYPAGMAWALRAMGPLDDLLAVVDSDIPLGSGVSSSAALEMAFGVLWNVHCRLGIEPKELALLGQKCENQFVGVQSGIMDQMACAMGRAGHAMFLDTRSLEIRYAPIPDQLSIVLCDTGKPRALTDSAYNERRSQCEEASRILGVPMLRDATLEMLERAKEQMPDVIYRRARHVITENARCLEFADALERADFAELGRLMRQSHESLRDDYEVSCRELDAMAEAAWSSPGCVGARMTGAGFGGACVALARKESIDKFCESLLAGYSAATGLAGEATACRAADGARIVAP
jgi:galactokinase